MKITKLYVGKNTKKEKDNQPDLILSGITEDGTFLKLGAFWKAKSGKGYSGKVDESTTTIEHVVSDIVPTFNRDSQGNEIKGQAPKAQEVEEILDF